MPDDDKPPRSHEQYSVEDKAKAATAFDRARELQQEKPQDRGQSQAQMNGSQQVKNSAPTMQPKPPSNVREGVDRQAHEQRMAKDDKAVISPT